MSVSSPTANPTIEQLEQLGRYMNPGPWWDEPENYIASIKLYLERAEDMWNVVTRLALTDKETTDET